VGSNPHLEPPGARWRKAGWRVPLPHSMELDPTFGVELVPCPTALPYVEAMNGLKKRDPRFTEEGFLMNASHVWVNVHLQDAATVFGPIAGLEPESVVSNFTPEFQRRWTELVRSKLAAPTNSVRQLSGLQFSLFNVVSDQNWDGIVIWVNYIAELKVSGRDKAADAAAFENPAWNATLAEYCTFIRRAGVATPRDDNAPFTWLLHDVAADPASARQVGDSGRNSSAA
jgi:hypothetical protein